MFHDLPGVSHAAPLTYDKYWYRREMAPFVDPYQDPRLLGPACRHDCFDACIGMTDNHHNITHRYTQMHALFRR